jgi:tetratricopeptide (TPR) repeat protein
MIDLAETQNKPTVKAVAMSALGRAQLELGEPAKGIATAQQAVALLENTGANGYMLDATNTAANVYERAGRPREAVRTLRELIELKN